MKAELTEQELLQIGKIVAQETYKIARHDGAYKEIDRISEKYTKRILEHYNPTINSFIEIREILKPIIKELVTSEKILEAAAKIAITDYFSTDSFKKLSIKMLEDRIKSIN